MDGRTLNLKTVRHWGGCGRTLRKCAEDYPQPLPSALPAAQELEGQRHMRNQLWLALACIVVAPLILVLRSPPFRADMPAPVLGGQRIGLVPKRGRNAHYEPNMDSLSKWRIPNWFEDAKFGVFIHWGIYSVPAWAPLKGMFGTLPKGEFFKYNPYAEWYYNSMRVPGSPTSDYHKEHYGKQPYYDFADEFEKVYSKWRPQEWGKLFTESGARYVVLTSKHHDGYTLWPSTTRNQNTKYFRKDKSLNANRDLVGDLGKELRLRNIFYGIYYSGGIDWTFMREAITGSTSFPNPGTPEYTAYADNHLEELITRYHPDILWNDIAYPKKGRLLELLALYFNSTSTATINSTTNPCRACMDLCVDSDRFGLQVIGYPTPEYKIIPNITPHKWEMCRGVGYSFSYNQAETTEHVIPPEEMVTTLIDIVSKNGNLLLGIGPMANGSIPMRLREMGKWLSVNGEGIYGSRPWIKWFGYWRVLPSKDSEDKQILYVFMPVRLIANATHIAFHCTENSSGEQLAVRMLGADENLRYEKESNSIIRLRLPSKYPSEHHVTLVMEPAPQDLTRLLVEELK